MKRLKAIGLSVLVAGQVTGAGCGNSDHGHAVTPIETVAQRLSAPAPVAPASGELTDGHAQIAVQVKDQYVGGPLSGVTVSAHPSAQVVTKFPSTVLSVPYPAGQPPDRVIVWLVAPGYEPLTQVVLLDSRGIGNLTATMQPTTAGVNGRIELTAPRPDVDLSQIRICSCDNPIPTFSAVVRADGSFEILGLPASNPQVTRQLSFTFKHPALRTFTLSRVRTPYFGAVTLSDPIRMEPL